MVTVLPDCVERVLQRSTMSIALRRGCLRSSGAQCAAAPTRAMSLLRSEQAGGSKAINILLLRSKNQQYQAQETRWRLLFIAKVARRSNATVLSKICRSC